MTASVLYAADGWDWARTTDETIRREIEHVRAFLEARPGTRRYEEELERLKSAAEQRGLRI